MLPGRPLGAAAPVRWGPAWGPQAGGDRGGMGMAALTCTPGSLSRWAPSSLSASSSTPWMQPGETLCRGRGESPGANPSALPAGCPWRCQGTRLLKPGGNKGKGSRARWHVEWEPIAQGTALSPASRVDSLAERIHGEEPASTSLPSTSGAEDGSCQG